MARPGMVLHVGAVVAVTVVGGRWRSDGRGLGATSDVVRPARRGWWTFPTPA
jgi:hypothetical protein